MFSGHSAYEMFPLTKGGRSYSSVTLLTVIRSNVFPRRRLPFNLTVRNLGPEEGNSSCGALPSPGHCCVMSSF